MAVLRDLPYERRLEELDLPTLEYRRQRFDMIILYKKLNNTFDFDYKTVQCSQYRPMKQEGIHTGSETTCKQKCSSQLFFA